MRPLASVYVSNSILSIVTGTRGRRLSWHGTAGRSPAKCRSRSSAILGLLVVGLAVAISGAARADGGIPGSLAILLPADQPQTIALATTFGLILSDDGGTTWSWTCEQAATTSMANLYAVGPPAAASGAVGDRFYALSPIEGLAFSDDASCSWQTAGGFAAGTRPSDFFVDPSDPTHVVAVASQPADGGAASSAIVVSRDGGATFGTTPLYVAPAGAAIVGVEIARSNPSVIYVAFYTTTATARDPVLARSTDGGGHWTTTDLTAPLGPNMARILAVDPQNSDVVYLRVIAAAGDALAVTRDGGGTFSVPATFTNGQVSAFARLQSGTVLVGASDRHAGRRHPGDGAALVRWRRVVSDLAGPARSHAPGRPGRAGRGGKAAPLPVGQELQRWVGAGRVGRRRADVDAAHDLRPGEGDQGLRPDGVPGHVQVREHASRLGSVRLHRLRWTAAEAARRAAPDPGAAAGWARGGRPARCPFWPASALWCGAGGDGVANLSTEIASTAHHARCRFPSSLYTAFPYKAGPIAQRSELAAHNRLVPGSNPGGPTLDTTGMPAIRVTEDDRSARSA